MKSKEKIGRLILRISLIFMVLLSIVLSAIIWGSDTRFSRIEQTSSRTTNKDLGQKSLRDMYVPTQVFYYRNNKMYQVYDGKNNLPLEFTKITESLTRNRVSLVSTKAQNYRKMLNKRDYMQLTYPDQITMPLFLTGLSKKDSREFNRFFVPTKNSHYLYLGNDNNNYLYRINVNNLSFAKLYKHVKQANTKIEVSLSKFKDGYSVICENSPQMQVYSYLTYQESDSYFVYRLLGSGSPAQRNTGNTVIYSNGSYQRLIAAKKTHNYEFVDYQQNKVPKLMTSRLMESLYYVRRIGLSEPDLRFFDADKDIFMYQNFVEEYPIFLPGRYNARAQVKFASNGMTINFNSLDLQIPVPTTNSKKTLEPTNKAIQRLEQAGYKKADIEKILIGYTIQETNDKKDNLVDLQPTYYVKINNAWQSLDDWLNLDVKIDQQGNVKEGLVDGL